MPHSITILIALCLNNFTSQSLLSESGPWEELLTVTAWGVISIGLAEKTEMAHPPTMLNPA